MHDAALQACGISFRYCRLHVRSDELSAALKAIPECGFVGANLTIPHKASAIPMLNRIDASAEVIGAVNTVAVRDGKLTGYNTDGPGLVRAIREAFGVELKDLRVVILGAGGGAGRAIAIQCALEGCARIVLCNRTTEKVTGLRADAERASGLKSRVEVCGLDLSTEGAREELGKKLLYDADLMINCTSVGMQAGEPSPVPPELLPAQLLVYDTIYTAAMTPLMVAAAAAGARSANGLSMLLHQGALAFQIWFERDAPVETMRAALMEYVWGKR